MLVQLICTFVFHICQKQVYSHSSKYIWFRFSTKGRFCNRTTYLASTSVETRPGITFRISLPKFTNTLSIAASSCSSMLLKTKELHDQAYAIYLGDTIQIYHLGRYIVRYTVGNFVLQRRDSGAVKRNFRPYI